MYVRIWMYVCTYVRMHGRMDGWLAGWLDGWMDGCTLNPEPPKKGPEPKTKVLNSMPYTLERKL